MPSRIDGDEEVAMDGLYQALELHILRTPMAVRHSAVPASFANLAFDEMDWFCAALMTPSARYSLILTCQEFGENSLPHLREKGYS